METESQEEIIPDLVWALNPVARVFMRERKGRFGCTEKKAV